ncbi:MAG: TIGR03000 domain-containing protein [Pirellulales bacterium]
MQYAAAKPAVSTIGARLVLNVPADAVVYLVDQRMTAAGTVRQYNVPKLKVGKTYGYPLRVEIVRNGQKHVIEATQKIRQGDKVEMVCDLEFGALTLSHKEGQKNVLELTLHKAVPKIARK